MKAPCVPGIRIVARALAALAGAAALSAAGGAQAACQLEGLATIPVTMDGMRPTIHVALNGQDAVFLVDTGAFASVLSPSAAHRYRVRVFNRASEDVEGVGGAVSAQMGRVALLQLGGASFYDTSFLVVNGVDRDLDGVLGRDILGQSDAEYDFANGVMRLVRPKGCSRADVLSYWTDRPTELQALPSFADSAALDAYGEINGQKVRVGFDSGSAYSDMTLKAAARAGVTPASPDVSLARPTVGITGRPAATWSAPFDRVALGTEAVLHTRLRVTDTGLAGNDMLLGADFFLSHRIYVSRLQHRLYFTYNGGPVFRLKDAPAMGWSFMAAAAGDPNAPVDAAGFARRGAASVSRGDLDDAVDDFSRAIAMAPEVAVFHFDRAAAHAAQGRADRALADFDAGLALRPDDAAALLARALLQIDAGRLDAAEADIDRAAASAGRGPIVDLQIAGLYERAALYPQSIAAYDRWIAAHPHDPLMADALAGRCRARALGRAGLDLAERDCDAALRGRRADGLLLASRSLAHLARGEPELAIADADSALQTCERPFWALESRGLAELGKGLQGAARADLAAAAEVDAKQAERARKLGLAPQLDPVAAAAR